MVARSICVAAVLADQVDRVVQGAEHAEPEQVELHQPGGGAVVLVPLQHAALVHPAPLDRADLDHRAVADHHPAGMDAEVARGVLDLEREVDHRLGDRAVVLPGGDPDRAPRVDLLRPRVLLAGRVPERLGHVAHRRAGTVGDDVGDLGRVVPAVARVHVLDDLLAAVGLDVDVDVGRAVALGRQEALEQQAERHGVDLGDAERVADGAVGGAASALAEDVVAAAELDEVPDDEEVAGEAELLDDVELAVDRVPRVPVARPPATLAVAMAAAVLGDAAQVLHLGQDAAVDGGARERGQVRRHEREIEGSCPADRRPPVRRHRGSGRSGVPARRPSADGRRPRPAATGRARRGCGASARRRSPSPACAARARRSARCWWRCTRRRRGGRSRRARRCGRSRSGRRGPTARPARGRARTRRPAARARGGRRTGRRRTAPPAPPPCGTR